MIATTDLSSLISLDRITGFMLFHFAEIQKCDPQIEAFIAFIPPNEAVEVAPRIGNIRDFPAAADILGRSHNYMSNVLSLIPNTVPITEEEATALKNLSSDMADYIEKQFGSPYHITAGGEVYKCECPTRLPIGMTVKKTVSLGNGLEATLIEIDHPETAPPFLMGNGRRVEA